MIFLSLANFHIDKKLIEKEDNKSPTTESVDNSESSSHLSSPCKNTAPLQS